MIQEIIRHIKRKKGMYIVVMIAIVLDYVVTIIPTRIIQTLIDAISTNTLTKEMLVQQLTLFAIIIVAGYVISYIWVKYLFSESYKFKFTFRSRLFRKLVSMRIPFYDKFRSGDMMTRFTNDIDS